MAGEDVSVGGGVVRLEVAEGGEDVAGLVGPVRGVEVGGGCVRGVLRVGGVGGETVVEGGVAGYFGGYVGVGGGGFEEGDG